MGGVRQCRFEPEKKKRQCRDEISTYGLAVGWALCPSVHVPRLSVFRKSVFYPGGVEDGLLQNLGLPQSPALHVEMHEMREMF